MWVSVPTGGISAARRRLDENDATGAKAGDGNRGAAADARRRGVARPATTAGRASSACVRTARLSQHMHWPLCRERARLTDLPESHGDAEVSEVEENEITPGRRRAQRLGAKKSPDRFVRRISRLRPRLDGRVNTGQVLLGYRGSEVLEQTRRDQRWCSERHRKGNFFQLLPACSVRFPLASHQQLDRLNGFGSQISPDKPRRLGGFQLASA